MTVECTKNTKQYALDIKDIFGGWAWYKDAWRKMKRADYDAKWYDDYYLGVAGTGDLLSNWCEYLPGVKEMCDYGDYFITFDMDLVEAARWCEVRLTSVLELMAHHVNRCRVLKATDVPYRETVTDIYGTENTFWRYPALKPLAAMLHKDYPDNVKPNGDRRP